ncbi:murein biosynthesis integral membrane protein MurJ [Streptomyces tendae]|uniref:murein biosynthesis integral membrane protein MurJ n=1 Tax=Streptomyces tendae TaxID=1932 RepID=UPI00371FF953
MRGARGVGGADGTVGDAVPPARAASAPSTGKTATGTGTCAGTGTGTGTGGTGTGTRVTAPRPDAAGGVAEEGRSSGRFLARAALVTAVLSVAGSVLGLARDQALARLFGAGSETDAFLVAWTVPEFAATLLIEDGLAFALVPMFSLALARRAQGAPGDPVRALVSSTLPRLALAFAAAGALVAVAAPVLVRALAPGLPDHALAVDCTRLTATCVVSFGLAGYCSAALRAHRRFLAPAAIYVAYNTGIITAMFLLGGRWGVRSAAVGVAVGGVLMVAAQLPSLLGRLRRRDGEPDTPGTPGTAHDTPPPSMPHGTRPPSTPPGTRPPSTAASTRLPSPAPDTRPPSTPPGTHPPSPAPDTRPPSTAPDTQSPSTPPGTHPPSTADGARPLALALFGTVLLFALCRQSQVLIERFLASGLPSGAISHLNYAQKVAQIPMTLSLMLCTVTFPVVARALADGDTERARDRVERDVALAACLVLLGAATVVACAPQIIHLLFQRGAFTAADTAATAGVMRVYALGLLGQTVVGALARSYFSAGRASWYPFGAMAVGVVATAVVGARAVGPWGVTGIAAANAAGITVTAALLLAGMGPRSVPVRIRRVLGDLGRPVLAAAVATGAGALAAARFTGASGAAADGAQAGLPLAVGAATVGGVFVALCLVLGVRGLSTALAPVRPFRFLHPVTRRHPHGRFRFRFPFRDHR